MMTIKETIEFLKMYIDMINENESSLTEESIKMAIEALENIDKYRWHDLRKNPDDLPAEISDPRNFVLLVDVMGYCFVAEYVKDLKKWFDKFGTWVCDKDCAVAWREIEPFESEVDKNE